jgi:hypothetical protein
LITERLLSRLLRDGEITDAATMRVTDVESRVGRILRRYSDS